MVARVYLCWQFRRFGLQSIDGRGAAFRSGPTGSVRADDSGGLGLYYLAWRAFIAASWRMPELVSHDQITQMGD